MNLSPKAPLMKRVVRRKFPRLLKPNNWLLHITDFNVHRRHN
jgi:hypothetical protein